MIQCNLEIFVEITQFRHHLVLSVLRRVIDKWLKLMKLYNAIDYTSYGNNNNQKKNGTEVLRFEHFAYESYFNV